MTRALAHFILFALIAGCAAAETEVTVVTFNIRAAGLDDGEFSWDERLPAALDVLAEAGADLIGLQEATEEQRRDLDDLGLACVECDTDFSNRNTILYDESQLVLRDSGLFWLSETPQVPFSVSWGNEEWPRWVTWAHFEPRGASSGSRRFAVYNTHLDHRAPESRMPSLELILKHAAEYAAELPLVLLGDFNARPDRPEVRFLTEGNGDYPHLPLNDILAQPGQSANEATYRSFVDSSQVARLDYIFASEEFGYREARVMRRESRGSTPPSDHSPVRAVLTLTDEP
jgi:endonuclease/exonuclease/phosphatase family metal-dependent hydrolase